jgi:ABC-type uncharacterized transport system substrate-binding protein
VVVADLVQKRSEAIVVAPALVFFNSRVQLITLLTRHHLAAIFPERGYVEAGGLMSYGAILTDQFLETPGLYTGRLLKGEKPADLPVVRRFGLGDGYAPSIEAAAQALGLKLIRIPVRDALTLVRAIDALADERNLGLLWVAGPTPFERELLIRLAEQYRLPAIYDDRSWVTAGGFMSYGADTPALYRSAASYVDRVLRGAKVSELPVQYRRSSKWSSTSRP